MDLRNTQLSPTRRWSSYAKVRALVSLFLRSRRFQLRQAKDRYLNLGCGPNVRPGFVNVDYDWRPGILCWNLEKGLPFTEGSMDGVYSEHCLEHFPLASAHHLLSESYRVLRSGGRIRIVVPDAELYLNVYHESSASETRFPYQDQDGFRGIYTRLMSVNRVFYEQRDLAFGHNFMWDYETLAAFLTDAGFRDVSRKALCEGEDPKLLIDTPSRGVESLYVEAAKP